MTALSQLSHDCPFGRRSTSPSSLLPLCGPPCSNCFSFWGPLPDLWSYPIPCQHVHFLLAGGFASSSRSPSSFFISRFLPPRGLPYPSSILTMSSLLDQLRSQSFQVSVQSLSLVQVCQYAPYLVSSPPLSWTLQPWIPATSLQSLTRLPPSWRLVG